MSLKNNVTIRPLFYLLNRNIHVSATCNEIQKMTKLRVVDNSEIGKRAMVEGKPPKVIHVYNKTGIGKIGDTVLLAIKGEKKKGVLVGLKQNQKTKIPKFDSNNVVLLDETGTPLGTRIHVPIPTILRTLLKEKHIRKESTIQKYYQSHLVMYSVFSKNIIFKLT